MHGQIGGAAGGQQRNDAVNHHLFIHQFADWQIVAGGFGQASDLACGSVGQRIAQRGVRVNEGGSRQVQPHHFHYHLVGVGGAVEGAGADAVIRSGFGLQQRQSIGLAFGVQLTHAHFLFVR
ncbi:hypothetical protein D3C80_1350800 [compost metagenome]